MEEVFSINNREVVNASRKLDRETGDYTYTIHPSIGSRIQIILPGDITLENLSDNDPELVLSKTNKIEYREDMTYCDNCSEYVFSEEAVWPEDASDYAYCEECARNILYRCPHCEMLYRYADDFAEVYNEEGSYLGDWCEGCINEDAYWDDHREEYRKIEQRRDAIMQMYYNPEGILAKGTPRDCIDCNESYMGICAKHLRQQAQEAEEEELNLWVYDTIRQAYHDGNHNKFKRTKYREKHEKPYLYYGIELEALWRNKDGIEDVVKEFIEATGGLFVAEYDRSVDSAGLRSDQFGAEFISRPLSYKKWICEDTVEKLKKGLEVLKQHGAQDDKLIDCGLHVHMSKTFFERNTTKKVKDIKSDMDWFFQFFQPEIEKISRREYGQYCASKSFRLRSASKNFDSMMMGVKGKFMLEKGELTVSQGSGLTHHDCIIETPKTIEARTFKSTLSEETILATIEFCRALAHAARNKKGLKGQTLGDIMFCKDCHYLVEYARKIKLDTSRKLDNKMEVKI